MDDFRKWLGDQQKDPGFCAEYDRMYAEYEERKAQTGADIPLEESFSRLDVMLEKLEDRTLPLEEAIRLYQQGMKLLARCNEKIDTVEKQILTVSKEGDLSEF